MDNQKSKKLSRIKSKYFGYLFNGFTFGAVITTFLFAFIYGMYDSFQFAILWVMNLFSVFGLIDCLVSIFKGDKRSERKKSKTK